MTELKKSAADYPPEWDDDDSEHQEEDLDAINRMDADDWAMVPKRHRHALTSYHHKLKKRFC